MNKLCKRLLLILLVFATILSVTPVGVLAEGISSASDSLKQHETVYVLAGSDFQPEDDVPATGATQVREILSAIRKAGYTHMDGFLFAGDYEMYHIDSAELSTAGVQALQTAVRDVYGSEMREIYVQGNHDPDSMIENGILTSGGANDTEDYGVFVVHEKDYMWQFGDRSTVQTTAESLRLYLEEKLSVGYDQPIFVISHLPLHYSMRTYCNGDAKDADLLFNVLNDAGAKGLNIIYLFGHDHAQGWDDYMGGASVYLRVGDKINIARGNNTSFKEETLRFTYLNTGYVGYYSDDNATGVDRTLTMTVFEITGNRVVISRYSKDGLHNLKSVGKIGSKVEDVEKDYYEPNTLSYESPQILNPFKSVTDKTGTVTVEAAAISDVTLAAKGEKNVEGFDRYVTYDIRSDSYVQGEPAVVTIRLEMGYVSWLPVTVVDLATGDGVSARIRDGEVTFNTNRMGEYAVTQIDPDYPVSDTRITGGTVYKTVSELVSGENYVIVNSRSGYAITNRLNNRVLMLDPSWKWDEHVWRVEMEQDQIYLRTQEDGQYLSLSHFMAKLVPDRIGFVSEYYPNTREWTLNQNGMYLNQIGQATSTVAGGYSVGYDDPNSRWYIYQPRVLVPQSVTLSTACGAASLRPEEVWIPALTVTLDGVETTQYRVAWTVSDPSVLAVEGDGLKALSKGFSTATATLVSADGMIPTDCPSVTLLVGVLSQEITSVQFEGETVTVPYGISATAPLGCNVEITYTDGDVEKVPLTASMLKGEYNLRKTGTYTGLTVLWKGEVLSNSFTLIVEADDHPRFPELGGVRMDKTVTGEDFSSSGLLRVELTVSGMSAKLQGETGTEILPAVADGIYFDMLSEDFTLLREDHRYTVMTDGRADTKTLRASVTVLAYDLYTADDVDGVTVTADMVGTRKGTYRILETVTFNETGTEAYSDGAEENLLKDGMLIARTFIYNFRETGTQWEDDGNGEADIFLEANSICWKVGTLSDTELTLTYYAYLENSVEGMRETGEYEVNKGLILQYRNWVGNSCRGVTECPTVSWTQSTDMNGIYGDYYYVDGMRQKGPQLIRHEGQIYLIGSNDKLVKNDRARLTAELVEGFTLPDGAPLPVGTYRFDDEGRLIYPLEPETETETETQPESETEDRYSNLAVGVMGGGGVFVTVLALVTAVCLGKRKEKPAV